MIKLTEASLQVDPSTFQMFVDARVSIDIETLHNSRASVTDSELAEAVGRAFIAELHSALKNIKRDS